MKKFILWVPIILFTFILTFSTTQVTFAQKPTGIKFVIKNTEKANLNPEFANKLKIYAIINGKKKFLGIINEDNQQIETTLPEGVHALRICAWDKEDYYNEKMFTMDQIATGAKIYKYRIHREKIQRIFFFGIKVTAGEKNEFVIPKLYDEIIKKQDTIVNSSYPFYKFEAKKSVWKRVTNKWKEKKVKSYKEKYTDTPDKIIIKIFKKKNNRLYKTIEIDKKTLKVSEK